MMLGLTHDDAVQAIRCLSNEIGDEDQAVTCLIQMLSNIQKPTRTAAQEARRLGIDLMPAGIKSSSWTEFLHRLRVIGDDDEVLGRLFDSYEARRAAKIIICHGDT